MVSYPTGIPGPVEKRGTIIEVSTKEGRALIRAKQADLVGKDEPVGEDDIENASLPAAPDNAAIR